MKTDVLQTAVAAHEDYEWKQIKIDPNKTIATIGMKVNRSGNNVGVYGVKVYSDDYEELCNVAWWNGPGEWKLIDIPKGQQICGVMADTRDENVIRQLAFALGSD